MNFFAKNKALLTHLAVFAVFVGLVFLLVVPFLADIRSSSEALLEAKKNFKFVKEKSEKINSVRDYYKNMEPDLSKISGFLIDPKIPIDLIKFWESAAKEENLEISVSSSSSEKNESDLWPSISFQARLVGEFPNFMRFLKKVELSPYFLEVRSLGISRAEIKKGESTVSGISANLGLKIYTNGK